MFRKNRKCDYFSHGAWIFTRRTFRKRCCCLIIFCTSVVLLGLYITIASYSNCSDSEVKNALHTICDRFDYREVLGNMCLDLCEFSNVKANHCLPHHFGKEVVFAATYHKNPVVIKSSKLHLTDFDQVYHLGPDQSKIYPNLEDYHSIVRSSLREQIDVNLNSREETSRAIDTLSTWSSKDFSETPSWLQDAMMDNLWYLLQQTEYLLMKYFEDKYIFPRIAGTCGPFYAVEFVEPLDNYFLMFYPSWSRKFIQRAELALRILSFLEEVEKSFPSLHFCDVKTGHFGLDAAGSVKVLDMDMVFMEKQLSKNIQQIANCTKDKDCAFIDCLARCDIEEGRCIAKVLDNNFLRVCRNIFDGRLMSSFGLLGSAPNTIRNELQSLLQKCHQSLDDNSSHVLGSQLKHLLVKVTGQEMAYL